MIGYVVAISVLVVVVALIAIMWWRSSREKGNRIELLEQEVERAHGQQQMLNASLVEARVACARAESEREALQRSIAEQRNEREKDEQRMKNEFKNLACKPSGWRPI